MKPLSILPVLFLLFAFTTNRATVKVFDPYNMQIGYSEVAHTLGTSWTTDGDYWVTTQFNFETHTVRSLDKHDSFLGVAIQPNVSYTYWFNNKRYIFYWPGSGSDCVITQII